MQGKRGRGSSAILVGKHVEVPHLDSEALRNLHKCESKLVTRHISHGLLAATLGGSFKFGTISGYRALDTAQEGRFGDYQEGHQRDVFRSRSGIYDAQIDGISILNNRIYGFEYPLVLQYIVNDYCSCSSLGDFNLDRAKLIRERGNPDVDSFVEYDLEKLIDAIQAIISEVDGKSHFKLVAHTVCYGEKDRIWDTEGFIKERADRDQLEIWLGNIFVKSPDYRHEAELRIILIDPARAGLLPDQAEPMILNDPRIARAIVRHGGF